MKKSYSQLSPEEKQYFYGCGLGKTPLAQQGELTERAKHREEEMMRGNRAYRRAQNARQRKSDGEFRAAAEQNRQAAASHLSDADRIHPQRTGEQCNG